jgi:hypothetical protein
MAVCRVILPRPEEPEDSNAVADPCTPPIPNCQSNFYAQLEQGIAKQRAALQATEQAILGVQGCVFNPRFETSIYNSEDQDYHYPVVPDFEGKLLIKGLTSPPIRYGGEDQWSFDNLELWWSSFNGFTIKENAKIVINYFDVKVSFRAKNKKRYLGNFIIMTEVFELVPFN